MELASRFGALLCARQTDAHLTLLVGSCAGWSLITTDGRKTFWSPTCIRICGHEHSLVSGCQVSLKELLRTGLTAGRLVRRSQADGGQVWTADEALAVRRGDKPVIGLAADIGASRSGALYRDDEMWITRFAHKPTSDWNATF